MKDNEYIEGLAEVIHKALINGGASGDIAQAIADWYRKQGLRVEQDWQPIETVPRDGSEFIARYARQGNVMELVSYHRLHGFFQSKGEPVLGFLSNATHWAPTPSIDAAKGGGEL